MKAVKIVAIGCCCVLLAWYLVPFVQAGDESVEKTGERLVRELWAVMAGPDMDAVEDLMADGFQSVHECGAGNRDAELELIRKLDLGSYELTDFQVSREGPVLVATYRVSVEENIAGERLSKKPAPRLSVFVKTDSGWKWVAHANVRRLSEK